MSEKKHILLVDNNHASRAEVSGILENWGCHVVTSLDTSDGLEKFRSMEFRFVIVRFESQGIPCNVFVDDIKETHPDTEILVLSDTVSVEDAVILMKAGALDFIVTPFDHSQILAYAEKVFGGGDSKLPQLATSSRESKPGIRIITRNSEMERLLELIDRVADSTASVLIRGESGTGKEMFARYIHEKSNRRTGPFIAVNCAALPEHLLESELFGHEKGAFTGAVARKAGKFELADGGTILLDEITEMQYHLQSKLLRVIQEREVDRVGGTHPVRVDVRIVATTNRDIDDVIASGDFREDLYYRLNVIPVMIPSLRQRRDDLELLADHFIEKFNRIDGRNVKSLTKDALDHLMTHPFRGNVREMENIVQRAVLLSSGDTISASDMSLNGISSGPDTGEQALPDDILASPLRDVERKMIFHTLDKTGGNRTHAAKILGISVRTLRNKLNEYKDSSAELPT